MLLVCHIGWFIDEIDGWASWLVVYEVWAELDDDICPTVDADTYKYMHIRAFEPHDTKSKKNEELLLAMI